MRAVLHDATRVLPVLVIALVMGAAGAVVLLFRDRLARLYDRVEMPDVDRERYKKVVLPLGGWVLIGGAAFLGSVALIGLADPGRLRGLVQQAEGSAWLQRGIGAIMIALGILNGVSHITGRPRPMKLGALMTRYGTMAGRALHLLAYTLVPIAFGALLLLES